jgi:hypothetical protein
MRSIPIVSCLDLGSSALLYIVQEARVLVGYNKEVPVGLQGSSVSFCIGLIVFYRLFLQGFDREVYSYCLMS